MKTQKLLIKSKEKSCEIGDVVINWVNDSWKCFAAVVDEEVRNGRKTQLDRVIDEVLEYIPAVFERKRNEAFEELVKIKTH